MIAQEPDDETIVESSGNAFADLGFPDAEELLAKVRQDFAIQLERGKH